jgi:hypothetical protein
MPETLEKLCPDRDLQCFFFQPSAIAALSNASSNGFTVSGTWRQQFDWSVVEWNRDNVYEHPAFRYLPDGDLSGLVLTYDESRTNCIPIDSDLFPTVDWPSLRVWATQDGVEKIYYVPLLAHATAIEGGYHCAYADFTLSGAAASGDYVGLAFLDTHYTDLLSGPSIETAVSDITTFLNEAPFDGSPWLVRATNPDSTTVRVYYTGGPDIADSTAGANGNRFGMYSYATGAETWDSPAKTFANGTSPTKWRITLDFSSLKGRLGPDPALPLVAVPTNKIRKLRWTYAADLQPGTFERSEFQVTVSNWTVTGTNRAYSVAGPGSRRIEDHEIPETAYSGHWTESRGNYSGGTIHYTSTAGDSLTYGYQATHMHTLYLGTRYTNTGARVSINVDGVSVATPSLQIDQEDVLIRYPLGEYGPGSHTLTLTHGTPDGGDLYFDFIELAVATTDLPVFTSEPRITAATDWDTEHSIALAPERTAWFINALGFTGRANHYVGALWFYELVADGFTYASGTVTFSGTVDFGSTATVTLGRDGSMEVTVLTKLNHFGDTSATLATSFAQEINRGSTGVWASAAGDVLTITSRSLGLDGTHITLAASVAGTSSLTATVSSANLADGGDGNWRTDLTSTPRLNRAVRDWTLGYFTALKNYGLDGAAAFSMEIQHGDPSASAGIAQVGPSGDPIILPTPSLQTNFSAVSLAFWQEAYEEIAAIQAAAGLQPYLQFGEVQWWYFPNDGRPAGVRLNYSGMPFYDAWNQAQFEAQYGHPLAVITANDVDPAAYPDETAYLPTVIGNFTGAIMTFVRASQPTARFEVLYPLDVNQTTFNSAINYPTSSWTPTALTCLKTESFGYTLGRNLDKAEDTMDFGQTLGFASSQRSHLVGVGDSTTAWLKEAQMAIGKRFESVVLFALDQFCLIGYEVPLPESLRRSVQMGS